MTVSGLVKDRGAIRTPGRLRAVVDVGERRGSVAVDDFDGTGHTRRRASAADVVMFGVGNVIPVGGPDGSIKEGTRRRIENCSNTVDTETATRQLGYIDDLQVSTARGVILDENDMIAVGRPTGTVYRPIPTIRTGVEHLGTTLSQQVVDLNRKVIRY